jgi:hypothetical protein
MALDTNACQCCTTSCIEYWKPLGVSWAHPSPAVASHAARASTGSSARLSMAAAQQEAAARQIPQLVAATQRSSSNCRRPHGHLMAHCEDVIPELSLPLLLLCHACTAWPTQMHQPTHNVIYSSICKHQFYTIAADEGLAVLDAGNSSSSSYSRSYEEIL